MNDSLVNLLEKKLTFIRLLNVNENYCKAVVCNEEKAEVLVTIISTTDSKYYLNLDSKIKNFRFRVKLLDSFFLKNNYYTVEQLIDCSQF